MNLCIPETVIFTKSTKIDILYIPISKNVMMS